MNNNKEMGFALSGIPNKDETRDNRTQEEINNEEKLSQQRYLEKSKAFGDTRSEEEILESLKTLHSIVDEYDKDVISHGDGVSLPENYESQWLERIKGVSPVFYEYYANECKNDPTLLSAEDKGRKFVIHNLFNRFLHE